VRNDDSAEQSRAAGSIRLNTGRIRSDQVTKDVQKWSEIVAKEVQAKLSSVSNNIASVHSALQQQTKSLIEDKSNRRKSESASAT